MKAKRLTALLLATASMCMSGIGVFAQTERQAVLEPHYAAEEGISPYYLVLIACWRGLKNEGNGKLMCSGGTLVQEGYTAETLMELQKKDSDGNWNTIYSWTGKGGTQKSFDEYRYVTKGTYQVKVTHSAYQGDSLVEFNITYSSTVTVS